MVHPVIAILEPGTERARSTKILCRTMNCIDYLYSYRGTKNKKAQQNMCNKIRTDMKYKKLFFYGFTLSIFLLALNLTSCKSVSLDKSYDGKEVNVSPGTTLTVTLESNGTTGFEWELTGISDNTVLEKVSDSYQSGFSLPGQVGVGGKEVWKFKALKKGHSTIDMQYSQPWNKGTKGAEKFSLTVVVD